MADLVFDRMPAAGPITGTFGQWYPGPPPYQHRGLDIGCPEGTPVYAPADGTVVSFTNYGDFGNGICLDHEGTPWYSLFAHFRAPALYQPGAKVKAGNLLGYSGATGKVTGAHLHWQVCKNTLFPVDISWSADPLSFFEVASPSPAPEEVPPVASPTTAELDSALQALAEEQAKLTATNDAFVKRLDLIRLASGTDADGYEHMLVLWAFAKQQGWV